MELSALWNAAAFHDLLERARYALARESCVYLQGQTLASEGIDEHTNAASCSQRIQCEIKCPFLVGSMQVRKQCCWSSKTFLFSPRRLSLRAICAFVVTFRYALSLRNLEEIMAERNVDVDHVTIWGWIQPYGPELSQRCRARTRRTKGSWRVDEMYLRVAGKWTYLYSSLYRAVDSTGDTMDFLLSRKRDADPGKRSFRKPCDRQTILVRV